jgi:AbrB family looped-hinge helix DNA binding protein
LYASHHRTLARLTGNYQVSIPKPIREALGLKLGTFFEVSAEHGHVVLRPKVLQDRNEFLKQLRKDVEASEADIAAGRVLGPFDNARDAMRALRNFAKKKRAHARRAV